VINVAGLFTVLLVLVLLWAFRVMRQRWWAWRDRFRNRRS
jgi:hypothetical protein